MIHSFDVDIAKEYGLLEAVLLNHLWFWIEHNRANETNFYDGNYWTYNSTKAFSILFPYASQRKIQNALKGLIEKGLIKTGNYNKSAYDRTLWYGFTDLGFSIMQKREMEDAKRGNGLSENVEPIPDNKPDKETTDVKPDKERKKGYDEILSDVEDVGLRELYFEYIKMRNLIKSPITDRALKMLINRVTCLEPDNIDRQKQLLEAAILNNWKSVYPLKDDKRKDRKQSMIDEWRNA